MSGFCVEPRPRALLALYGYGDITGAWYTEPSAFYLEQPLVSADEARAAVETDERWRFYLWCRQTGRWVQEVAGLDPGRDADALRPFRPVCNASPDFPPTLLVHGTADTDVPYE